MGGLIGQFAGTQPRVTRTQRLLRLITMHSFTLQLLQYGEVFLWANLTLRQRFIGFGKQIVLLLSSASELGFFVALELEHSTALHERIEEIQRFDVHVSLNSSNVRRAVHFGVADVVELLEHSLLVPAERKLVLLEVLLDSQSIQLITPEHSFEFDVVLDALTDTVELFVDVHTVTHQLISTDAKSNLLDCFSEVVADISMSQGEDCLNISRVLQHFIA